MNQEHFEILKKGVEEWNEWRRVNISVRVDLSWANLEGADLEGANLEGTYLSRADLKEAILSRADLEGAILEGAILEGANLSWAKLSWAKLSWAILSRAKLEGANLYRAKLEGANLKRADLEGADLKGADLKGADLKGAYLSGADLKGADLSGADLSGAILEGANLKGANLERAYLEGTNLYRAILYRAKLGGAILSGAKLSGADLEEADLSGAKLEETNLKGAIFYRADLKGADFSGAKLSGAYLEEANLEGAILSRANLEGANLTMSVLSNADFSESDLFRTIFGLTNLSTCKGLETVKVSGECVIDFQTLQNSKNIPRTFLRKIGLPDIYVDYLPEFMENPINLFPVFLSHSWANKDFAGKLYESLIDKGVKVWYDEKKVKPGDVILESIHKGINLYDKMILVCSEQVLNSWWVKQELERIFAKERQYEKGHGKQFRLLIPITIDKAIHESNHYFATSIKERAIGDFQDWQDEEKFNTAVNKLIQALNVDRGDDNVVSFL